MFKRRQKIEYIIYEKLENLRIKHQVKNGVGVFSIDRDEMVNIKDSKIIYNTWQEVI